MFFWLQLYWTNCFLVRRTGRMDCTVGTAVNFKGGESRLYLGSVLEGSKVDIGSRNVKCETFEAPCDVVLLRINDDRRAAHEFVPLFDLEH